MHTVVFRLKPDPETSGAARRPLPESSPRQLRQVPLSEPIVRRALVPMDVSRCAQSTWFIRVGIFFRSFRRDPPNHWRAITRLDAAVPVAHRRAANYTRSRVLAQSSATTCNRTYNGGSTCNTWCYLSPGAAAKQFQPQLGPASAGFFFCRCEAGSGAALNPRSTPTVRFENRWSRCGDAPDENSGSQI